MDAITRAWLDGKRKHLAFNEFDDGVPTAAWDTKPCPECGRAMQRRTHDGAFWFHSGDYTLGCEHRGC